MFDPTRTAGLGRLHAFATRMGRAYAAGRNLDRGPGSYDAISMLSPWLRHRLLEEREVVAAALAGHSAASCEKFVQEVFWRTYWKGHLEWRPGIWRDYTRQVGQGVAGLATQAGLRRAYDAACLGETGIACFDAWARELVETGWLHNHARMWFASIWIFTLRLPWALGADFTYRHFVDGDPASNTLSWRWVAGLQTRGKHYLARAANIATYTGGRFDPRGELDELAPPLVEDAVFPLEPLPLADAIPQGPVTLLLTEEDLHPETLLPPGTQVVSARAVLATHDRSPLPIGQPAATFAAGAVADAASRAARHWGCAVAPVEDFSALAMHAGPPLVTAWPPIGPVRARLEALASSGVPVAWLRRPWDSFAWPHATRGYFALKVRIPALLAVGAA